MGSSEYFVKAKSNGKTTKKRCAENEELGNASVYQIIPTAVIENSLPADESAPEFSIVGHYFSKNNESQIRSYRRSKKIGIHLHRHNFTGYPAFVSLR